MLYFCELYSSLYYFSLESDEILQQMVAKLTACVPAEQAKNFAKSLDLNGNDIPDFPYIQLSELCQVWITKKHHECTPEALVEALICTEGLGKYASGIGGNFSNIGSSHHLITKNAFEQIM